MLVASQVPHQVKEVGAVLQKEINSECKTLAYISLVLTILELVMVAIWHYRKSKFCRGHMFSNAVKIMVFISDVQNYIPTKLCKTAGSIHLFKITGTLKVENINLNKNYIWDTLEIDWKKVTVTFNDNKVNLPSVVTIKLQNKIKVRCLMKREPLLFHLMLKQESRNGRCGGQGGNNARNSHILEGQKITDHKVKFLENKAPS